jgi:hypothetical protein
LWVLGSYFRSGRRAGLVGGVHVLSVSGFPLG